ncbi:MAG: V-type ATPase subunit [Methanomicrobiales archaeon]|nr:V-type ATPase subunit [Methanomicrobiales archaeon]
MTFGADLLGPYPELIAAAPPEILLPLFALLMLTAVFLVKLMAYLRIILAITQFSYPNAFVTAKGNPCLDKETIGRIMAARDLADAVSETRSAGLDIGIREIASLHEIEAALQAFYFGECDAIEAIAPDSAKPLFRAYTTIEEAGMLKTAIRALHAGMPEDAVAAALTPIGILSTELVRSIAASRSIDDLVSPLDYTPYGSVLSPALPAYHDAGVPLPLEEALDRFVAEELGAVPAMLDAADRGSAEILAGTWIDAANIRIVLRAVRDTHGGGAAGVRLLPGGYRLSVPALQRLAESRTAGEVLGELEALRLHGNMAAAIGQFRETGSLIAVDQALDAMLLDAARDLAMLYRYGPAPLIQFLVGRRMEVQNLGILLRGIDEGFEADAIMRLTIQEEAAV